MTVPSPSPRLSYAARAGIGLEAAVAAGRFATSGIVDLGLV